MFLFLWKPNLKGIGLLANQLSGLNLIIGKSLML
jgi:hypothetical protein